MSTPPTLDAGAGGVGSWIWDLVAERAASSPQAICALDESGRTLSFGQLAQRGDAVAGALFERGVGIGSSVCWQLPSWLEALVLTVALSRLGAVQVPLLPIYRERELSVVVGQVAPALVVTPSVWRGFDYAELWHRLGVRTLVCDRDLAGSTTPPPPLAEARPGVGAHRWVFFTSGTTGTPKGARHTDASVLAGPRAFCQRVRLSADDRYPIVFPFTHIGGIGTLMAQLLTGASALLDERFDPETTLPLLSSSGITIGAGGTPLVQLYLERQRRPPDRPLFPRLRLCLAGAAPKPPWLHQAVQREMGGRGCISTYGLTEAPFLTISDVDDADEDLAATEGRPAAGAEVRIVGADGAVAAVGAVGEIRARGPQVMLGYLDAQADSEAFDEEGWLRTGDLGSVDERGNVTISGRIKDIIVRKGENISAVEVEQVLSSHPALVEVAVVGLPDAATGERCCAVIVVRDGHRVTLPELARHARDAGLAVQKIPEQLAVIDLLPRNASGKVVKHELVASLQETP